MKIFNFNFTRFSTVFGVISIGIILVALYFVLVSPGFKYGNDFTAGVEMIVNFDEKIEKSTIVEYFASSGITLGAQAMEADVGSRFMIRGSLTNENMKPEKLENQLEAVLKAGFSDGTFKGNYENAIAQSTSIGATVSGEYISNAFLIIIAAMIAIILYLSFRFHYRYSIAAIIAVLHDVIIMAGVIAFLGIEFNRMSIIAILTIFGYSVNDTIVLFDRVREITKENALMGFKEIINKAINSVLMRTFITSLTTIIVVMALYMNSEGVTKDFSFILLVGLVAGTYSSMYIASGFMIFLNYRKNKKKSKVVDVQVG